jgi:hypothetical protein
MIKPVSHIMCIYIKIFFELYVGKYRFKRYGRAGSDDRENRQLHRARQGYSDTELVQVGASNLPM